jgi:hypothetical protein
LIVKFFARDIHAIEIRSFANVNTQWDDSDPIFACGLCGQVAGAIGDNADFHFM